MSDLDASPQQDIGTLVIVDVDAVPEAWRHRARAAALITLTAHEAKALLETPEEEILDRNEHDLARLVARGAARKVIAQSLGIPLRTVDRRLAALYRRFDVQTKTELAILLARRGF